MKISACLVIRNEEKVLERCLRSISGVVDEIVLVHDGQCTDDSLKIAKQYTDKIFIRPLVGEAEYHRPFSYQKATGDWILQIDADEFLSDGLKGQIRNLIQSRENDAYSFAWPYFDGKGYIKRGPFSKTLKPCLFRRSRLFMIGLSHEYPRTYGYIAERSDLQLEHRPIYDNYTLPSFKSKWISWTKLQAKQIYQIKKAPTFNIKDPNENVPYRYYQNILSHPILNALTESVKFMLIYLYRGILWSGVKSLKIALLELAYIWLVRLNILRIKYERV